MQARKTQQTSGRTVGMVALCAAIEAPHGSMRQGTTAEPGPWSIGRGRGLGSRSAGGARSGGRCLFLTRALLRRLGGGRLSRGLRLRFGLRLGAPRALLLAARGLL